MTKHTLFALWGGAFILCAGLGFLPEQNTLTLLAALGFFVPPGVLLYRAGKEKDVHTRKLVRSLAALSLGLTLLLLITNFMTALSSEALGTAVYYILVIVSSPMVCSGHWAMSLFGWACLLMVSLSQGKKAENPAGPQP